MLTVWITSSLLSPGSLVHTPNIPHLCRWGDHLYNKGEYDAAMTQYLETLACLEPSYVIRRFLDAQRIHNLTCYLEVGWVEGGGGEGGRDSRVDIRGRGRGECHTTSAYASW